MRLPSLQGSEPAMPFAGGGLVLTGLFVALFCIPLLVPRDLWVQDEARYGEVVREMLETGQWLVPHLNGHPYPDKPPLYFWLVIAVGWVVGHGELAFRLTTTLSTAGAVAAVGALGRELAGTAAGFLAGTLFATTFLTLVVGHIARMDMLLTATAAFAWVCLERFRRARRPASLAAFWALAALGLAVKGPIALLFTVLPGAALVFWTEGWRGLRALRPELGLLLLAGLGAGWAAAVVLHGHSDYLENIWNRQLLGRAVDAWSHREPFYFYAALLPVLSMPWTGLAVGGLRVVLRERAPARHSVWLFSLLPLGALSLVSGKLFIYVEPLMPAFAVAAALGARDIYTLPRPSLWTTLPPVVVLALAAGAVGYVAHAQLGSAAWQGYSVAAGLAGMALVAMLLSRRPTPQWLWGWLGLSVGIAWLVFGWLAHLLNPLFSARDLGEALARQAPLGTPVAAVSSTRGVFNYYAGRLLTELQPAEVQAWWAKHPQGVLVLKTSDLREVFGTEGMPSGCRMDRIYRVELKEYHVLAGC
jgi:4-amino-4-deoxy-L-arabinose transferase-like glycosyltransferase